MQHLFGRRGLTRLAASAAILGLLAAACSSSKSSSTTTGSGSSSSVSGSTSGPGAALTASAPGITATSITIGSHQPLTGPAAPGYSEISAASNAYFQWVNDNGGIYGRKISYLYKDDGYNPANTTSVVRQLVLQNNVYAIFNGLGTPTHLAVEGFLNAEKVPDVFVASGCTCWNNPSKDPETFGFQTDYTVEGEINGQYVTQNLAGKKVGYFAQNDEFGSDGVKGLDEQIDKSAVVSRQTYDPTNTTITPQIQALQSAGAQVVVLYTIPAFTALTLLTAAKLNYHPTWVVSNVGSDPPTLTGLLQNFSKGTAGASLLEGLVTDAYLVPVGDTSSPWIQLFKQIHDKYIASLPFDGNVNYGLAAGYAFVQAMFAAGKNPTRADLVKAIETSHFQGPGLVPFQFSSSNHQGYDGVQMGKVTGGAVQLFGTAYTATDAGNIQSYSQTPPAPPANGVPSGS